MEPTTQKNRIIVLILTVLLTAGAVGGGIYYSLNQQIKKQDELIFRLEELKKELTEKKEVNSKELKEKTEGLVSKAKESLAISVIDKPTIFDAVWRFKFNRDVDATTLNKENIRIVSIGASLGTAGTETDDMSGYNVEFGYDKENKILTIMTEVEQLACAACTHRLDFKNGIKTVEGDSLKPISFDFD